jgi:hypothetical protein
MAVRAKFIFTIVYQPFCNRRVTPMTDSGHERKTPFEALDFIVADLDRVE